MKLIRISDCIWRIEDNGGGHGRDLNLAIWTLESWNLVGGNNRYYRTLEMAGK